MPRSTRDERNNKSVGRTSKFARVRTSAFSHGTHLATNRGKSDRGRRLSGAGKIIGRANLVVKHTRLFYKRARRAIYVVHYTGCNLNIDLTPRRYITVRKTHDGRTRFWRSAICRYRPPRTARANTRRTTPGTVVAIRFTKSCDYGRCMGIHRALANGGRRTIYSPLRDWTWPRITEIGSSRKLHQSC